MKMEVVERKQSDVGEKVFIYYLLLPHSDLSQRHVPTMKGITSLTDLK
jgi:hypothetical protein